MILGIRTLEVRLQSFLQFLQRFSQSSVLASVARTRLEFFNVPEQGFRVVCVEIKNNHVESWAWRRGTSAGESVTELFKLSLYEFVSRLSLSLL